MDSLITAAARALARGDPLGALKRVALREDPPSLALRGIAMAQLGDLPRAKTLLRKAVRAFGANEAVARARCIVAEADTKSGKGGLHVEAVEVGEVGNPAARGGADQARHRQTDCLYAADLAE